MKLYIIIFSSIIGIVLLLFIIITPLMSNAWSLLTEKYYIIPKESSVFRFKATVMNSGSGDWWLYGKDNNYYYYFIGDESSPYLFISRVDAETCENFDPADYTTWCMSINP